MRAIIGGTFVLGLFGMVLGQTISRPPVLVFEGNMKVSTQELVNNFKACSRDAWKTYVPRAYEYYREKCTRRFLFSRGFLKATVHEESARLDGNRYTVRFVINEGPRYRWGKITFKDLKPQYSKLFVEWFGWKTGEIADGVHLQDFVFDKLHDEYSERGYIQSMADFDLVLADSKDPASDGIANVTINIDEGRRFTVGRVEFRGVSSIENEKLIRAFPLKQKEVFVQSKLAEGIEAINRSGKYQPANKDSDVQILLDEESGEIDLIVMLRQLKK